MKQLWLCWLRRGHVDAPAPIPIEEPPPVRKEPVPPKPPASPVSDRGRIEREVIRLFTWWTAEREQERVK